MMNTETKEAERMALIERAREMWAHDELEIDDSAQVSKTGDGTGHWVQAWVYVEAKE